jgi:hypothetical protein
MPNWKKLIVSGSDATLNTLTVSNGITGSLLGTSSWASNALTASFITASNVYGPHGSSSVLSSSYAQTASYSQNLVVSGSISTVDYIDFNTAANPSHLEGRIHWNDTTKTIQIDTDFPNFSIDAGHQSVVRVYNDTGVNIQAGKAVYINGSQGNTPTIATASWETDPSSAGTIGITATLIPGTGGNRHGYVITSGLITNINTNGFAVGDRLFLSSSGQFTNVAPDAPLHEVRLGVVIVNNATTGVIYVSVVNGFELTELHDVRTTTESDGDLLVQSGSLWINSKQLTGSYSLTGSLAQGFNIAALGNYSHAEGQDARTGTQQAYSASISSGIVTMSAEYFSIESNFPPGSRLYTYNVSSQARNIYVISQSQYVFPNTILSLFDTSVNIPQAYVLDLEAFINWTGNQTISGDYSHAEGTGTYAIGYGSHAEGASTLAAGVTSHAEGNNTQALNLNSHAEGSSTKAVGSGAHSEGTNTQAIGDFSHSEGASTTATGLGSHAEGASTQAIGEYSHAEGQSTQAIGNNSHAEGNQTQAIDDNSHAEGFETKAIGAGSHAEGSQTQTRGLTSHAEGRLTITIGDNSHAEGSGNVTVGEFSHTEGQNTLTGYRTPNAIDSFTVPTLVGGFSSEITFPFPGDYTSYYPSSTGGYMIYDDFTYGYFVFIGSSSYDGNYTTLFFNSVPTGSFISYIAVTANNNFGLGAHAEGYFTTAVGQLSHTEGYLTISEGGFSHAEGLRTITLGGWSHAEGVATITSASYQHVQGIANIESAVTGAFIIGNGIIDGGGNALTRSNLIFAAGNTVEITGSLNVSGSITGSLEGTSSWAKNAQTASFITASNIYGPHGSSSVISASQALTASYVNTLNQNVTIVGNQTISGSLTVTQDFKVLGSASITYISESTLNIGTNLITVNTFDPSVRFGGLAVIDSGSSPLVSASFLYDSLQDEFLFVHRGDGVNVTSSHFVLGPETYNSLGNEIYLTKNRIPKGTGIEHLNDSNISDTGTVVNINSNTTITGSLTVTGNYIIEGDTVVSGSTLYTGSATFSSSVFMEDVPNQTGSFLTLQSGSGRVTQRTQAQVRDDIGYYGLTFAITNGYY